MADSPEAGLKPKQIQTLHEFRGRVQDVIKPDHDDHYLLKWLRARKFDIAKAEKMLREHVAWRKKWGVDTILEDYDPPEVLAKYWPGSHFGFDKEGRPIIISVALNFDMKGIVRCVTKEEMMKHMIYQMETIIEAGRQNGKKIGKRVDQLTEINDMDGFSWKLLWTSVTMDSLKEMSTMVESNYPETLFRTFVINAPTIFPILYNLFKPLMSEDTKSKIKVLGGNWKEEVLKYIDADQLPVHWGGTCTDPDGDPRCTSKIVMGGIIPKSYYREECFTFDPAKTTTVTVASRASHTVEIQILERGTIIRWMFKTKGMDMKIRLFQKKESGDREIIPSTLVNSHVIPEEGSVTCEEPGQYIFQFDNTYSWMHSKELTYQIDTEKNDFSIEDTTNT